ncbi:hypothetical protein L3X38_017248 [Prunus dulcis]|uniref:Uncharacterized protein n=1 Tax=Prunus dulcis TaxID=3755 RepID=A0AAD4Z9Y7_PRUDU|nr:hypothetical protein L3X38_017245 [Prunus dulcis]KAI5337977.1 hypothetical protein L3X38_017248 [Prunus dulcis]
MGSLPMCPGRPGFLKEDEVEKNNGKRKEKYDGIRTLSSYKRRTSATQKNQPTSRARPSIVKQLEIYSSHPSPPPFVFLPPLGRKPAKPSFACSKPPSSIGKLISLSLKIAKPVKA